MRIAVLCSRLRVEEKLLLAALRERGVVYDRIDPRKLSIELDGEALRGYDTVLLRCLSHSRAFYLTRWLQHAGVPAVNPHWVIATCGDKLLTSVVLQAAGVPIPRSAVAFTPESALGAIERMGYPVVLKPVHGSWGRLLAKVNGRQAAEAILEHRSTLGGYRHSVFYVQDYVDKPGRDIRTLVVGDETVYAVYRHSSHWITNTARGGTVSPLAVTPEIDRLSRAAATAAGGGIVAVDILETLDGALLVNEVNHTPEFHGAQQATDVDIAGRIVDHVLEIAKERRL